MKKMNILILFLGLTLRLYGPEQRELYIPEPIKIEPYERAWQAVCWVETRLNPCSIGDMHLKEWSYGISQIRRERLEDYNKRTASHYIIDDLYSPEISKKIFMYYASQYGPYRIDDMIRAWNGSGKATYIYLNKVKQAYERF